MTDHFDSLARLEFPKILSRLQLLAATELGRKRTLAIRPAAFPGEARRLSRLTSEMKTLLQEESPPPFDGITDCRTLLQQTAIAGSTLTGPDLRRIADLLKGTRIISDYFVKRNEKFVGLKELAGDIVPDKVLEYNLFNAIGDNGIILDSASKTLRTIRQEILALSQRLRKKLEAILERLVKGGWAQDEIITTRDGRMVVPVKSEHKRRVEGFVHSSSSSGLTVFLEPAATLDINNEILDRKLEEEREIARILRELTGQVGIREHEITRSIEILEQLDTLYAQAQYSLQLNGSEVILAENENFLVTEARHPLLIEQKGIGAVVPFELTLGDSFNTLVVTGPNAGGKSVALKAVGLITVMAHAGMHVPADAKSVIPWISDIFVDIGDEQSIENNLSTFTSHLEKLRLICNSAGPSSLVLVDEIAGGTDPKEGGAIAAAVLQHLTAKKAFTIATTHNSFLKTFAHDAVGIENGSMEFDQTNLVPAYRLRFGIPGSSYAIEIAKRLKFPDDILKLAKDFLGKEEETLERLLAEIDSIRAQLLIEQTEAEKKGEEVRKFAAEYSRRLEDIKVESASLRKKAVLEARGIVEQANSIIENTIREIREHQASTEAIRDAKTRLREFGIKLSSDENSFFEPGVREERDFEIGDRVILKGGQEIAEIIEILDRNNLMILSGSSRIKVKRDQLFHVNHEAVSYVQKHSAFEKGTDAKRSIDVRGMFGDEAINSVDKFVDEAVLSGLEQVIIVHGIGTGALRAKILDYLKTSDRVIAFRGGDWNEGGAGVTIVDLK